MAAPRLNTPPFAVGVEHDDPAVVGSDKSEKHGAHAVGQLPGVFLHRSRAHEFTTSLLDIFHGGVQCHNHVNHQDHRPQLSPRRISNSACSRPTTHDDTAASMRFEPECPLCGCNPAQLDVGIIVGHFLVEPYVK